jgi:hypothetical protein
MVLTVCPVCGLTTDTVPVIEPPEFGSAVIWVPLELSVNSPAAATRPPSLLTYALFPTTVMP